MSKRVKIISSVLALVIALQAPVLAEQTEIEDVTLFAEDAVLSADEETVQEDIYAAGDFLDEEIPEEVIIEDESDGIYIEDEAQEENLLEVESIEDSFISEESFEDEMMEEPVETTSEDTDVPQADDDMADEETMVTEDELSGEPALTGAASGKCGSKLTWKLENGLLIISGSGNMYDYDEKEIPWNNNSIKQIEIKPGVTSIGNRAFSNCENLVLVTMASSVKRIGKWAFSFCRNLEDAGIGQGVLTIEDDAYNNCWSLSTITIPDSVSSIGFAAFSATGINLKKVIFGKGVKTIGDNVFYNYVCPNPDFLEFRGNAPVFSENSFYHITAKAYYPVGNTTWTTDVRKNYGGNITWIPVKSNGEVYLESPAITGLYNSSKGGDLRWKPAAGAEKYVIYRTNGGKTIKLATVNGSSTSYMDTSIKDNCWGKVYVYYVQAQAGSVLSSRGEGKTIQRLAPMNIMYYKNDKNRTVTLKWSVASGSNKAAGYEVQYADNKTDLFGQKGTFRKIAVNGRNSQSKAISGLTKGKTYYFRVRAYVNYTHSVTKVTTKTWSQYSNVVNVKISK